MKKHIVKMVAFCLAIVFTFCSCGTEKTSSVLVKKDDVVNFKASEYINNFDVNGFYGTLRIISMDGDKLYSVEKSGAFSCIGENGVLYFEEYNMEDDSWTISYVEKKKKKIVDTGVDGLVLY